MEAKKRESLRKLFGEINFVMVSPEGNTALLSFGVTTGLCDELMNMLKENFPFVKAVSKTKPNTKYLINASNVSYISDIQAVVFDSGQRVLDDVCLCNIEDKELFISPIGYQCNCKNKEANR